MTTPVQHGFPDWGRSVSAADILVTNFAQVVNVTPTVVGRFFVGNLPFLYIAFASVGAGARLQLDWYDSQTGGLFIGTRTVDVLTTGSAVGTFPNMGPYVELTIRLSATPSTVQLRVWQTLVPVTHHNGIFGPSLIAVDTQLVAPGATFDSTAVDVRWGWGHWFADLEAAAAYRHSLYAIDYLGVLRLIDVVTIGGRRGPGMFLLPPQTMMIRTVSGDAVNRFLWAVLNSASIPMG